MVLQILWEQLQSIYSALKFFQILYSYTSKLITKINSTKSFTRDMVLKFLPETIHELNILQKNFQDLTQHDKLVMQLT